MVILIFCMLICTYIRSLQQGDPDTEVAAAKISKLFKLCDNGLDVELVHDGPLKKSMMVGENVYLLHSTERISLWVGKKAKIESKRAAMNCAVSYLKTVRRFYFVFHFDF